MIRTITEARTVKKQYGLLITIKLGYGLDYYLGER